MVYLSGDTHGYLDIQKVIDFFEIEPLQSKLTKEDILIILGDVGICWDNGKNDEWVRRELQKLPVTTLWLDGNHENFQLLSEYPVKEWHGGYVHRIGQDILHLMRGYCYEIQGQVFWIFGGGNSVDRNYRTQGVDWWPQEMPTMQEYNRGMDSLKAHGYRVDYVLTHTAPRKVAERLVENIIPGEEKLQHYLQKVAKLAVFKEWYFGHWHMDTVTDGKYFGLMERIVRLEGCCSKEGSQ